MSTLDQIAKNIIKEQELIIGPVAWSEAKKVNGLHIEGRNFSEIRMEVENIEVIDKLVRQYERLFGRASTEVCKDAASILIRSLPSNQVPNSLR